MPWYHHFFHGLPQVAWKTAQTEEQTRQELELLVESLEIGPDDHLLDVFCGYGRHALPLARLGCRVTGVDISTEYVHELQSAAHAESLAIDAIQADILQTVLTRPFDAAYCIGNSFSFFPYATMLRFLKQIAGQLRPGGRFLAHSGMVAETVLPDYQERNWMPVGEDIFYLAEHDYNPERSCIDSHLTYIRNGVTETRHARHYIYTIAELRRLLRKAGLRVIDLYGTTDGQPFALGDESVWILAEVSS
ncbi:class I SAM-dependent methyltransferase [Nibrella saemangeumensis]|uniref:Class I SAM-dependent methyltransferase n=1 Tax=Nibrella saemangeumensis TaxID=1084526 RepID=A0ABP8MX77_9BACT